MLRTAYLLLSTTLVTASAGFGAGFANKASSITAPVPTAVAIPSRAFAGREIIRVAKARDGLFYLTLDVNDHAVRFLVDTGASVVVLSKADAARAGVTIYRDTATTMLTAGGQGTMYWGSADRMGLTGVGYGPATVAIAQTGMATSLLGQDFLSRLGTVTIRKDVMIVSAENERD